MSPHDSQEGSRYSAVHGIDRGVTRSAFASARLSESPQILACLSESPRSWPGFSSPCSLLRNRFPLYPLFILSRRDGLSLRGQGGLGQCLRGQGGLASV